MKLTILQEKLKSGLNIVERAAARSLTLPVLNNILISSEKNFLQLSATDLEIAVIWQSIAKVDQGGRITIPSRLLFNFINLLPNEKIDISSEGDSLLVSCGSYKTKIKGFPADEFPIIPKIQEKEYIFVEKNSFCQGLSQVADIAVLSTARPEISGIYFSFQKNFIVMAATDSFRLGEKKIFLKSNSSLKSEYSFVLPQKTARELINIFQDKEGEVKIYFSPNQVMFESVSQEADYPEVRLISKLIDGEYPNYKEIIPSKHKTKITIGKGELVNQVKAASLFSGKISEIKISAEPPKNEIKIFSQSSELGEHQSSASAKTEGEAVDIAFNHKFLLDGLLNIKSSEVVFELNSDSGPGVIRPVGDETYLYVIMPIKAS